MKNLFQTNDDWDNHSTILKFNTKIKTKPKTLKNVVENETVTEEYENLQKSRSKTSTIKFAEERKKDKINNGMENSSTSNPKSISEKGRKKKLVKSSIANFDEECKFTPLLRKNILNDESGIVLKVKERKKHLIDTSDVPVNQQKFKKRKLNCSEDGDAIKKRKISQLANLNGGRKPDSTNNNLKNIDFANKLRENLLGGRFRFLNEQLYTVSGGKAKEIFEQDEEAFKAYHKGYRQQVEKWPFNPLDRIIKRVRRFPKHMIVADFGCGEARLAESIQHKCFSIDLVSSKPNVIACDMANTPLKSKSVDIAIFCLSLMGINLKDFICEANRVLKNDGTVYVAEIGSRFENVKEFKKLWEHLGFELIRQDVDKKNYFYFFDFKKVEHVEKNVLSIVNCTLKPCIYKKR